MNERYRTFNKYKLAEYDETRVDGKYQMPIIKKEDFIPDRCVGFNYAKTSKDKHCAIHFYLDDYQFERLWNKPEDYVDILKQYDCIFTPDFSLYLDMPLSMKIWNTYRSRLLGQYYQDRGIKVIPTVSWGDEDTFDFCFDGIEQGSIVTVSTVGILKNEEAKRIFEKGFKEMVKRINPKAVLIYGQKIDIDFGFINLKIVYYKNEVVSRLRKIEKR